MKKLLILPFVISMLLIISCDKNDPTPEPEEEFTGAGIFRCKINGEPFEFPPCKDYLASFEIPHYLSLGAYNCNEFSVTVTIRVTEEAWRSNLFICDCPDQVGWQLIHKIPSHTSGVIGMTVSIIQGRHYEEARRSNLRMIFYICYIMVRGGSVYILTNRNNSTLYVGVTSDLYSRITDHKDKAYPRSFSARYNLNKLVYHESFNSIEEAIAREKQLKAGSRRKKIDLINKMNPEWVDLLESIE